MLTRIMASFQDLPAVRYPNAYVWLVFLSAMDIIMTRLVLYWGGYEANAVARTVLSQWGLGGMVLFKFALTVLVIIVCEIVGRRRDSAGRKLAWAAVIITCFPVTLAFLQLLLFRHRWKA